MSYSRDKRSDCVQVGDRPDRNAGRLPVRVSPERESATAGQHDLQAVGHERDEHVRLDAGVTLVVDRTDREVTFQLLERLPPSVSCK
jgi:hypothetical protein